MNQSILANVEVTRACAASPGVLASCCDIVLKRIDAREGPFPEAHDFLENLALMSIERSQLAVTVVNDTDRGRKTECDGALRDDQRVIRMVDPAPENRIDVDMKVRVLRQKLQLLIEDLEALLRDIVRLDVIDADLQELKARAIESLDAVRGQKITVGNDSGDGAIVPNPANDFVQVGMQQRLPAADGDHRGAKGTEPVDASAHFVERHWLREVIELIAIRARKIAAAHGDDMSQQGMLRRQQRLGDHAPALHCSVRSEQTPFNFPVKTHSPSGSRPRMAKHPRNAHISC